MTLEAIRQLTRRAAAEYCIRRQRASPSSSVEFAARLKRCLNAHSRSSFPGAVPFTDTMGSDSGVR
jgi:hypothetical protein